MNFLRLWSFFRISFFSSSVIYHPLMLRKVRFVNFCNEDTSFNDLIGDGNFCEISRVVKLFIPSIASKRQLKTFGSGWLAKYLCILSCETSRFSNLVNFASFEETSSKLYDSRISEEMFNILRFSKLSKYSKSILVYQEEVCYKKYLNVLDYSVFSIDQNIQIWTS